MKKKRSRAHDEYIRAKSFEVSSRSTFGRPSEMDRVIERSINEGWTLEEQSPIGKNKYLVTFVRPLTDDEIAARERARARNGCIRRYLAILAGAVVVLSIIQTLSVAGTSSRRTPTQAHTRVAVAPTRGQNTPIFRPSPTRTMMPTLIPTLASVLTRIPAYVSADNINARECPSTDCRVSRIVNTTDRFWVIGEEGEWYRVIFEDQVAAFMFGPLVRFNDASPSPRVSTCSVTGIDRLPGFVEIGSRIGSIYNLSPDNLPEYDLVVGVFDPPINPEHLAERTLGRGQLELEGITVEYGFSPSFYGVPYADLGFDFLFAGKWFTGEISHIPDDLNDIRSSRDTLLRILRNFVTAVAGLC